MRKTITVFAVICLVISGFLLSPHAKAIRKQPKPVSAPSQDYIIEVPKHHDKLLIYFHGSGENIANIKVDPQKRPIFDLLESKGYIVAYSNAHGNNWGNQASVDDYKQLSDYLHFRYKVSKTVFLSQSMGGLDGLETVSNGNVPVSCWAGIYPAINLNTNYSPLLESQIQTAFPDAGDIESHNPIRRTNYHIPMKIYASTADTVVPTASNADPFVKANPKVIWTHTTGDHGDNSNFQPADLADFYQRCK